MTEKVQVLPGGNPISARFNYRGALPNTSSQRIAFGRVCHHVDILIETGGHCHYILGPGKATTSNVKIDDTVLRKLVVPDGCEEINITTVSNVSAIYINIEAW